ncbi:hypothetical protein F5Y18DRAFT_440415 [Xylariaceae sp. FL1019]|nr:hypothetical protein F5Y18DRAFT_440415 [Xylariaceae sp. FL1019]
MYGALALLMLVALATGVEHATIVGLISAVCTFIIAHAIYRFVRFLYIYDVFYDHFNIHRKTKRIDQYKTTKDGRQPWAFVTNVDNALGRGFAEKLAELGFNIVLHCHELEDLTKVRTELERQYPSRCFEGFLMGCKTFVPDHRGRAERIADWALWVEHGVNHLALKVFVNCTGLVDKPLNQPTIFDNASAIDIEMTSNRYVVSPIVLTSAVTRLLAKEGSALMINIESINDSIDFSRPMYRLNRSFLRSITRRMAWERKAMEQDVDVLGITAGPIAGVGNNKRSSLLRPSVETFVIASLRRVGCGEMTIIPYFWHAVMAWLTSRIPKSWRTSSGKWKASRSTETLGKGYDDHQYW